MKINDIKILKETVNDTSTYLVIVEIKGFCYWCRWVEVKPSKDDIRESIKLDFKDNKTWLPLYGH